MPSFCKSVCVSLVCFTESPRSSQASWSTRTFHLYLSVHAFIHHNPIPPLMQNSRIARKSVKSVHALPVVRRTEKDTQVFCFRGCGNPPSVSVSGPLGGCGGKTNVKCWRDGVLNTNGMNTTNGKVRSIFFKVSPGI